MNTLNIFLSSNTTNHVQYLDTLTLNDYTKVSLNLERVFSNKIPSYIKINWGDGTPSQIFNNDMYGGGNDNQLSFLNYYGVFTQTYFHEFYPSNTSNYKQLSSQVLIKYSDGNFSHFVIPMIIRTYDFSESVGEYKIIDYNAVGNDLKYHIQTIDGEIMEIKIPYL